MPKKKIDIEEMEELQGVNPDPDARPSRPASDYVVIVNLTKGPLQCPRRNGRTANVGPRIVGLDIHKSEPILKKDLHPITLKWAKRGMIRFEAVRGGEAK